MTNFKQFLMEEAGKESSEYQKVFKECLAKYKVKSPNELSDEDKKKFYEEVDAKWNSKEEPGEDGETKETK